MVKRTRKNRLEDEVREQRRKVVKKTMVFGLLLLFAGAVAAGFMKLMESDTLPIRTVKIEGNFKYLDTGNLKKILEGQLSHNFFKIDIDAVQTVVKGLPWVDGVSVRRKWPDTLMVKIQEQRPLARWKNGGFINQRGERFLAVSEKIKNLPELEGPEESVSKLARQYLLFSHQLEGLGLRPRRLTVTHRRSWQVSLDNGLEVQLGRLKVASRLRRFIKIYRKVISKQLKKIESVDMRYTNGFAIRWKPAHNLLNDRKGGLDNA